MIFSAGGKRIESWWLPVESAKGTILIFHGYLGKKSCMLNSSYVMRTAGHNPARYAGSVNCPALLMWGREDAFVSAGETRAIYTALQGPKMLKIWEGMGHQNCLRKEPQAWPATVLGFLQKAGTYSIQK